MTTMAAVIACSMPALAEGDGGKKKDRKPPKALIEKFDKDGDGKLNDAEKEEAKAAMKARREAAKAKMLELHDTNKDGKISEEEREAAKKAMAEKRKEIKAAVLAKFDANDNGKIDEDEREGVREWVKENYPDARPPHRKNRGDARGKGKGKKPRGKRRGGADE